MRTGFHADRNPVRLITVLAAALVIVLGSCAMVDPPASAPVVNVLRSVDLTKHFFTGNWRADDEGQIVVSSGNWSRLCLPWQPVTKEYSVEMEFTRLQGREGFGLLLTPPRASAGPLVFQLSAEGNRWVAINEVKDIGHIHVSRPFEQNGKPHTLEVRVLQSGVEALLDGQTILRHDTDYSDIQYRDWGFGDCSLGLISWYNRIVFHSVAVREFPLHRELGRRQHMRGPRGR